VEEATLSHIVAEIVIDSERGERRDRPTNVRTTKYVILLAVLPSANLSAERMKLLGFERACIPAARQLSDTVQTLATSVLDGLISV
jgi:hypothetical protein